MLPIRGGADKSLAQPTSRCHRTESIGRWKEVSVHVRIFKSFLVTEAERKHVTQRARFQQHRDASCHQVFFFLQGKAPNEIHAILTETLGEHGPLYATVKNWVARFKGVDFSTCVAPRTVRPKTVTTTDIIDQIHALILEDRRISVKQRAEQLGISRERVGSIIHEDLGPEMPERGSKTSTVPFFIRRGGHCCRGDLLDGQHSDFFFEWHKLEQRAKKCIELRGEYVEKIPNFVAVACFLPGRAKDLSAPHRISVSCIIRYLVTLYSFNNTHFCSRLVQNKMNLVFCDNFLNFALNILPLK